MWDILCPHRFAFLFISFLFTFSHTREQHTHTNIAHPFPPLLFFFLAILPFSYPLYLGLFYLFFSLSYFFSLIPSFLFIHVLVSSNFLSAFLPVSSAFYFHSLSTLSSLSHSHIFVRFLVSLISPILSYTNFCFICDSILL